VTDINLYSEFVITMTGPALGLVFIYLGYRARLLCMRRSMAKSTDDDENDAETGQNGADDANNEQYAMAARRIRDLAVCTRF
jgi:hypothetical protein